MTDPEQTCQGKRTATWLQSFRTSTFSVHLETRKFAQPDRTVPTRLAVANGNIALCDPSPAQQ